MSGVNISREFGINPTIPVCCWCGRPRNEIAMLGTGYKEKDPVTGQYKTAEAPRYMVIDFEPCDECKQHFSQGIAIVEAKSGEFNGKQQMLPQGRYVVMKREAADEYFKDAPEHDEIMAKGMVFVDVGFLTEVMGVPDNIEPEGD